MSHEGAPRKFRSATIYEGTIRATTRSFLHALGQDDYEIQEWAVNNMNWCDFDGHQVKVSDAPRPDFQEAWMSGDKGFVGA